MINYYHTFKIFPSKKKFHFLFVGNNLQIIVFFNKKLKNLIFFFIKIYISFLFFPI